MTRFENAPFSERVKELGDTAEAVFEEWANKHKIIFVRMGFNRPPFHFFYKVNSKLRLIPDYLCEGAETVLVEVKGCGAEGLKIKLESLKALVFWNVIQPVKIFVFNSSTNEVALLTYQELVDLCYEQPRQEHSFPDGKKYVIIPVEEMKWEPWTM